MESMTPEQLAAIEQRYGGVEVTSAAESPAVTAPRFACKFHDPDVLALVAAYRDLLAVAEGMAKAMERLDIALATYKAMTEPPTEPRS